MRKILAVLAIMYLVQGCAGLKTRNDDPGLPSSSAGSQPERERRLARVALELLSKGGAKYNPEKGKAYLEYSLKQGNIKTLEVPAPVLLELIRSERVAADHSRSLEEQLEIIKAIDRTKEGEL